MIGGERWRYTVRRHKKIVPLPISSNILTCVVRTGEEQSHHCYSISKTGRNFLPDFVKKFFFLFESYSSFFLLIRDILFETFFLFWSRKCAPGKKKKKGYGEHFDRSSIFMKTFYLHF
jgi:hypothetical protein